MRFVMCMGIAAYHFSPYFFHESEVGYAFTRPFAYFTDIFFVISGFFLARGERRRASLQGGYLGFLGRRMARIYPLHLVTLSFFLLIAFLVENGSLRVDNPARYDLDEALPNALLIHSWGLGESFSFNYVSWSLSALMLMYILFPVVTWLTARLGWMMLGLIAIGVLAGDVLTTNVCGERLTTAQDCDVGILRALPSFAFGVWLDRSRVAGIGLGPAVAGLALGGVLAFGLPLAVDGIERLDGAVRLFVLYGLIASFLAADAANLRTPLSWAPLRRLAPYSFAIFLLHPVVATGLLAGVMPRVSAAGLVPRWVPHDVVEIAWLVLGLAVTLVAAVVSTKAFEKPAERFLLRRFGAGERPAGVQAAPG